MCASRSRLLDLAIAASLAGALAGCAADAGTSLDVVAPDPALAAADLYRAGLGEAYPLPAVDVRGVDPAYLRQEVDYPGPEAAGTIVVETGPRFLYLVEGGGRALRYGVGVGKEGMRWTGHARIGRKARWPRWVPTPEMMKRNPRLNRPFAGGMSPGIDNPLGARALYLYTDGRDTLYRIHGTAEAGTIGKAVSSGCIRMLNQDVIDLYRRVEIGAPVIVRVGRDPEPAVATVEQAG